MALTRVARRQLPTDVGLLDFEGLFRTYYKPLHAYALSILKEMDQAEEIVQQVFVHLWEKQDQLGINQSATAYLYRAVHNRCLNQLKHEKVKAAYQQYSKLRPVDYPSAASRIQLSELQAKLDEALSALPEQCRTIFQLSRFEALRYQEIADRLSISVKTVENQMGKALRLLREKLADYLPLLLILFNLPS
ncbi:MAG: RNA polymerase sigma-70 factor [Bacteroidetes bacterium]|nr:RNA polymerase sigma-70 factor [Bacteroidota bacterium]